MYENKQNTSQISFLDKNRNKNDSPCVFVLFLLSLDLWCHLKAVLSTFKVLSCTNSKKNGKAGDSEADRSSSKLHKSHKNGPN